jgi:hypothetical protein
MVDVRPSLLKKKKAAHDATKGAPTTIAVVRCFLLFKKLRY